jgi:protein-tyrosine phosphatase
MTNDCSHLGDVPIKVGPYEVFATGMKYIWRGALDLLQFDVLVPLDNKFGDDEASDEQEVIWGGEIPDFAAPGEGYVDFLSEKVIPELEAGKRVVIFCTASHGRTGTVIAGLIAMLEPETDDPIEAVRKRHCGQAVETREQAIWVRDLHQRTLAERITEVMADPDLC